MRRIRVTKLLTANDVGATGSHQAGVAILKSDYVIDFFPYLDKESNNPDKILTAFDVHSGEAIEVRYVYYNNWLRGGTRNEFRLTRTHSFLSRNKAVEGDVLVIERTNDGSFHFAIERLLAGSNDLGAVDFINTKLRDGWTIGLPFADFKANDATSRKEGEEQLVLSRRYERSPINRRIAVEIHGRICRACRFSFDRSYGPLAGGYIEIHHLVPVSTLNGPTLVDPESDLVPLCANCHRMAHRRWPPYSPEELQEAIRQRSTSSD